MRRYLYLASLLVWMFACETDPYEFPDNPAFIINGSVDTNVDHDAVAFLYQDAGYACGGTLITPNVLLTAAHCVTYDRSTTKVPVAQLNVVFCQNLNSCHFSRIRDVIESWVHPSYDPQRVRYDIALLRLSGPAPGDVKPIPVLPASLRLNSSNIGNAVSFIGYGLTSGTNPNSSSSVRRIFNGTIAGLCQSSNPCTISSYQGTVAAPWTFWTNQSSGGTCQGDSGGPGLITRNNVKYVAGITSYGYSDCAGPGVYVEATNYESQIQSFINNPPVENCTDGIDNNGSGAVDCADGACTGHASCPTSPCTDNRYRYLFCNETVYGKTQDGVAAYSTYGCWPEGSLTGPEIAYLMAMPPGTQVTVTMTPLDQDLDAFVITGDRDSCNPSSCLKHSINEGLAAENISLTLGNESTYFIVESYRFPSQYSITTSCVFPPENCTNGIDDDGDGLIDCADPDCANEAVCIAPDKEYWCNDGIDNDGDGLTDCADPDCADDPHCEGLVERACADGVDNDGDGLIDCDDPDCFDSVACRKDDSGSKKGCASAPGQLPGTPAFFLLLLSLAILRRLRHKE